jgi:hypothetical protein
MANLWWPDMVIRFYEEQLKFEPEKVIEPTEGELSEIRPQFDVE